MRNASRSVGVVIEDLPPDREGFVEFAIRPGGEGSHVLLSRAASLRCIGRCAASAAICGADWPGSPRSAAGSP